MALSPQSGTANTTVKVADLNALITAINAELDAVRAQPDEPSLADRVAALEDLIRRVPAEAPTQLMLADEPPPPPDLDTTEIQLVYDKATLYYSDIALHAQRISANRWHLFAALNYIVVTPTAWTYDEIVEGTADEVYAHAQRRLVELAELKPKHDAVHDRVRAMSEGAE